MRNDARPIGEDLPRSPTGAEDGDARESVTHDRQSHVVNKEAEERDKRDRPRDIPMKERPL
jgi:hypothetical protein